MLDGGLLLDDNHRERCDADPKLTGLTGILLPVTSLAQGQIAVTHTRF